MLRRGDLVAGLTVWAVLVPESLAYASIAGVSPVVGLYAAPPALVLYAIFGSSKHLIVGPMSATAALSAAAVASPLRADAGAGDRDRRRRARRRPAAARLPRELHLRAGAQGVHRRPRADDHRRPGAEAVRRREGRGRLLRAALARARRARRHAGRHAGDRPRLAGAGARPAPLRARGPRIAGRRRLRRARRRAARSERRRHRRLDRQRAAVDRPSRRVRVRLPEPGGERRRRRARRLRRGPRGGKDVRGPRITTTSTPTAS